jgi:epoxyqueuosine reductase
MSVAETLIQTLEAMGWRGAVLPFAFRDAALRRVSALHDAGMIDDKLYTDYLLPIFERPVPDSLEPQSIILIATPDYSVRMQFTLDDVAFPVMTAPGYLCEPPLKPLDVARDVLAPLGFSAERVSVPQKTLATISGFARYGRNNISYVDGLGSFHALVTLVSDLPCGDAPPHEQETLAQCASCGACASVCPTGAISDDRFLLHAERCLTFWNEQDADVSFPDWIERDGHNALFGCLYCQQVCPENRPYRDRVHEGPTFDAATTQLLLSGAKKEDLPEAIVPVLAEWRLDEMLEYLPRNLGVLVEREKARRAR